MKKTSTLLTLALFSLSAFAQIPNGSFENWGSPDPISWQTSNNQSSTNVTQVSPGYGSNSAMKMEAWTAQSLVISSVAACPNNNSMFPYVGRPLTITGWYKSNFLNGDKASVNASLQLGGNSLGAASVTITNNTSVFQQFTATFSYSGPQNSDSSAIGLALVSPSGGSIGLTMGSYVIFDDFQYQGTNGVSEEIKDNSGIEYVNLENGISTIVYNIEQSQQVKISLCDISGREIKVLLNEKQDTGKFRVREDMSSYANGIYFVKLDGGNGSSVKKVVKL